VSILHRFLDERFFEHRRRSTSHAGVAAAELAVVLFLYRHFADGVWNWDLLAVGMAFVVVKLSLMAWYRVRG
jgi:hypothetical protein